MRNRKWRRLQSIKHILKRTHIIKEIWKVADHPWINKKRGILDKHNLTCSCFMCHKKSLNKSYQKKMRNIGKKEAAEQQNQGD